jgi:hypothetical protein
MSSDLVAFLRARLDEDEQVAVAAGRKWSGIRVESYSEREPEHVARHDPARVLAEVVAKRRIVAEYTLWSDNPGGEMREYGYEEGLEFALRYLALPYASHPEYRADEWSPDV